MINAKIYDSSKDTIISDNLWKISWGSAMHFIRPKLKQYLLMSIKPEELFLKSVFFTHGWNAFLKPL